MSGRDPRHLDWGRRLAAVAQTGLHYAEGFDVARYEAVQRVAAELLAAESDADAAELGDLLGAERGYATPKVDVRGVVARGRRLLLVREAADGGWTLPGGWADMTDEPREAVEREVAEEAGLAVRATRLLAVVDRERRPAPPLPFRIYKLLIACEACEPDAEPRADGVETLEAGFFDPAAPPPLSEGRTHREHLAIVAERLADPGLGAHLD